MAKKNNNNGVENKNKNNDGGEKKKKKAIASKIVKWWVKSFQGAESVKSEGQANKLTVVGKVDPTKLRDELATKTKNKVDLVSPQPEKDNKVNKDDANDTKKKQPEKTDNDEKAKEKKNNNGVKNKNKINDTNNNDGGEKKGDGFIASKIVKRVKPFQGAESVKSEGQANKPTVVGKVDPTKLRDELATKTKNKVDLVSPQPEKDNKVNKDDANDTKKKQPEKTDNDEKAKEAPLTTAVLSVELQCQKCRTRAVKIAARTTGCDSVSVDMVKGMLIVTGSMDVVELVKRLRRMHAAVVSRGPPLVPPRKKFGGNDDDGNNNDGNEGNGGGSGRGDEKKKEEDEGNGGGKMKYPAGQYGFGRFSCRTVHRHGYGYQNGALKMGEKMLLMCCEVFGLLVMYNHLAKDIYTMSIHSQRVFSGV